MFQIGDRVRLIKEVSHLWTSCLATIRIYGDNNSIIGLEFDEDVGGHTLDGSVKIGRGLWVGADDIELVARRPFAAPQPAAQEPAAPALKVEVGKFYRTRDGRKVGPVSYSGFGTFGAEGFRDSEWHENGRVYTDVSMTSPKDLIAEWHVPYTPSAPIATQIDAINEEYGPAPTCRKLVRTSQGYGYELARFGDYVWVDTGQTAPITLRADKLAA